MNFLKLSSESEASYTAVSDIFIDQYLPSSSGDYVKIYLYLLRLRNLRMQNISVSGLADTFNQTEGDIKRALNYWDRLGVIRLHYDEQQELAGIQLNELISSGRGPEDPKPDYNKKPERTEVNNVSGSSDPSKAGNNTATSDAHSVSVPSDNIEKSFSSSSANSNVLAVDFSNSGNIRVSQEVRESLCDNNEFRQIKYFSERYLSRPLNDRDVDMLAFFYTELHFSSDLIDYLLGLCVEKGSTKNSFIQKIALDWANQGITTVEEAKAEASNHNPAVFSVKKAFGLNRNLAKYEVDMVNTWTDTYLFNVDMIVEACNRTVKQTHDTSFKYADSILSNWYNSGVKDLEGLKEADKKFEATRQSGDYRNKKNSAGVNSSATAKANSFNNFHQRPKEDESFYDSLLSNNN